MSENKEKQEDGSGGLRCNEGLGGFPPKNTGYWKWRCKEAEEDRTNIETMLYDTLLERDRYRAELENIANADWRKWESGMNSAEEFVTWAQSRARHALSA